MLSDVPHAANALHFTLGARSMGRRHDAAQPETAVTDVLRRLLLNNFSLGSLSCLLHAANTSGVQLYWAQGHGRRREAGAAAQPEVAAPVAVLEPEHQRRDAQGCGEALQGAGGAVTRGIVSIKKTSF